MQIVETAHGARITIGRSVLDVDRTGIVLDGTRLPPDTTVHVDDRFLTLDNRSMHWVRKHECAEADFDRMKHLLEHAAAQAREAYGKGQEEVPEDLRRLR